MTTLMIKSYKKIYNYYYGKFPQQEGGFITHITKTLKIPSVYVNYVK